MKLGLLVFMLSLNSFAGLIPSKIERLSKKFFSRQIDVETSVIIAKEVSKGNHICLRKQFEMWINEYNEMDSSHQNQVKSFFAPLDQVIINQPILSGQVSKTEYDLRYERCYDSSVGDLAGIGTPFRDCDIYLKTIGSNAEVLSGNLPLTQASTMNTKLDFTMQYLNHLTRTINLYTSSPKVYNDVNSVDSEAYRNYVREGRITRLGDDDQVIPECDFKDLGTLIKSF